METVPANDHPACPECGEPTRLVRVLPALGGMPELRTFRCGACGEVFTQDEWQDRT